MTEQLVEIGGRLAALRDIMDIPAEQMARDLHVSVEEYLAYERGERDYSFSFLYNAASLLGVDHVSIIKGESPKLNKCALIKSGEGFTVEKDKTEEYKHLAYTIRNRAADPYLVTVKPDDGELTWHAHPGQEFNHMLSGKMTFHHGEHSYQLDAGDSLYFDASVPHTMRATSSEPARFIAVVMK